jgi:hypothetical protein
LPQKGWKTLTVREQDHINLKRISERLGHSIPDAFHILVTLKLEDLGIKEEGESPK